MQVVDDDDDDQMPQGMHQKFTDLKLAANLPNSF